MPRIKYTEKDYEEAINVLKETRMRLDSRKTTDNIFIKRINELIKRYKAGERSSKFYRNLVHLEAEDK